MAPAFVYVLGADVELQDGDVIRLKCLGTGSNTRVRWLSADTKDKAVRLAEDHEKSATCWKVEREGEYTRLRCYEGREVQGLWLGGDTAEETVVLRASTRDHPGTRWLVSAKEGGIHLECVDDNRTWRAKWLCGDPVKNAVELAADNGSTLTLWEIAKEGGRLRLVAQVGHVGPILAPEVAAFSPDERQVLTGGADKSPCLWDLATGRAIRRFVGHSNLAEAVAFVPDGREVLSVAWDGSARLWNRATGKEIRRFEGHTSRVVAVTCSRDGRYVLTGSEDKTARLWSRTDGSEVRRFTGHTGRVESVDMSPDGQQVLTAGAEDRTARLWDVATGKEAVRLEGHTDSVREARFTPDGCRVLTGSWDKSVRLWDAKTGKEIRRYGTNLDRVASVDCAQNGKQVAAGVMDNTVRVWDVETGKEIRRIETCSAPFCVRFSPNGRRVLIGMGWGEGTQIWDLVTGEQTQFLKSRYVPSTLFTFSPMVEQ